MVKLMNGQIKESRGIHSMSFLNKEDIFQMKEKCWFGVELIAR